VPALAVASPSSNDIQGAPTAARSTDLGLLAGDREGITYTAVAGASSFTVVNTDNSKIVIQVPGPIRALHIANDRLYIGCETGQLVVFLLTGLLAKQPALVAEHQYPHPIHMIGEQNGEIVVSGAPARPPSASESKPKAAPPPPPGGMLPDSNASAEPPNPSNLDPATQSTETQAPPGKVRPRGNLRGLVTEIEPNHALVDIGRKKKLRRGDHVEVFETQVVNLGLGETTTRHVTKAIGKVVDISDDRARVEFGVREQVESGDQAITTDQRLTRRPVAPPVSEIFGRSP